MEKKALGKEEVTHAKQQLLVDITEAVRQIVEPVFEKLSADMTILKSKIETVASDPEYIAQITMNIATILSRLDILDKTVNLLGSTSEVPKKNVRVNISPKNNLVLSKNNTVSQKKIVAPANDITKIKNAYLYFRYIIADDVENARKTYLPPNVVEKLKETNPKLATMDVSKDEKAYYRLLAVALWGLWGKGSDMQAAIKTKYEEFNKLAMISEIKDPLQQDTRDLDIAYDNKDISKELNHQSRVLSTLPSEKLGEQLDDWSGDINYDEDLFEN